MTGWVTGEVPEGGVVCAAGGGGGGTIATTGVSAGVGAKNEAAGWGLGGDLVTG